MGSLDDLIHDLKKFEGRKVITKELLKELRKPVSGVRKAVRTRALNTLPRRGGLAKWVAKASINTEIKLSGKNVGVRMFMGRDSTFPDKNTRADLKSLDQQGKVLHPSWGRRARQRHWHAQSVTPGFFTGPATEIDQWRDACVKAVDHALDVIRHG